MQMKVHSLIYRILTDTTINLLQSDFLIAQQEILQHDVNLLFFKGIPDSIHKIKKSLLSTNQKITNPPDVDVTLEVLWWEFNETDLDAQVCEIDLHDYSEDKEGEDSDFNATAQMKLKPAVKKKKSVKFELNIVPAAPIVEPIPMADMDTLSWQVQELAKEKQCLLQELANACNPVPPADWKYFICDRTFIHSLGVANCIETRN